MIKYKFTIGLFILVACGLNTMAQNNNTEPNENPKWSATFTVGFADLEAEDSFKTDVNAVEAVVFREIKLLGKFSFVPGVGFSSLSGDFFTAERTAVFISNHYLILPLVFRYNERKSQDTSFYIDAGIYSAYLIKSSIEDVIINQTESSNSSGRTLGAQVNFGIKQRFSASGNFIVGFMSRGDLVAFKNASKTFMKTSDLYGLQIGLNYDL